MTPTEIFLAIIAAQLGFICLFLVIFIGMEVMNGMYVRRCYAEAQLKEAERAANNPLANLVLQSMPGGGQQLAAPPAAPEAPAPCENKECKEGGCDACKVDTGGNYL